MTGDEWSQVIEPYARGLGGRSGELAAQIVERARMELPALGEGPDGWEAVIAAVDAGAQALADRMARGDDPADVALPPPTIALIRDTAQRGVALAPLVRVYRFAYSVLWADAIPRLTEAAPGLDVLGTAAQVSSEWLLTYLDSAKSVAEATYATERERWLRSSAASAADTIEGILNGRQRDEALASQRLRHDLRLNHVALVAWPDDGAPEELEGALTELAQGARPDAVLVHPLALTSQTAWMSKRRPFTEQELEALTFEDGARVAVGTSQPGIDGFRLSYEQALEARRVAVLARRRSGSLTRYSAVALSALATVDVAQARDFVRTQLGALAGDDDVALRLAATLRVYLDENASPTRTAKRLGIHENTVANRVRQAEKLLGRPLPDQRLELHVALALAPIVR
jgi:PucR C-terminal helix-turn-helix domain/GGDEF-like domain